ELEFCHQRKPDDKNKYKKENIRGFPVLSLCCYLEAVPARFRFAGKKTRLLQSLGKAAQTTATSKN
ncbi:hypothetical protein OFC10_30375, partial [Escherichia coli]|nr:hypothetical protein [Escherichia coli]